AAGLAVRELIRADIAVLRQGSRNAADGISMLQTAEGAMSVLDELLVRMRELAEQAATDSYSPTQRTIMNSEFQELASELTRIAETTGFNEIFLLNSILTYNIHVGSTDTIDLAGELMTADGLGLGSTGTAQYVVNEIGTPNPNLTGYITGDDGANGNGTFALQFGAVEPAMSVTFTAGTLYSMNQVAQIVNAESQLENTYNAASITYDSGTNLYSLKISAKDNGAQAANFAGTTQIGMLVGDFTETVGAAGAAVSIDTTASAVAALSTLITSIKDKDAYRAKLGYLMNRLEAAVSVLDIQSENLLAAESRISDVDVAVETASLTRNQVLSQAGISMLAQANAMPQMALTLLQ
ncbi:MAG: flagellin N-terminal helical domain-containing protein, partial [Planctomycetota bacterium]